MQRITITTMSEDEYGSQRRKVVGWFDAEAAEKFPERKQAFDGANLAGVHLRDQNRGQVLYRTAGDRWVLMGWSAWQGEVDTWEYIGVADAREWLLVNEADDETLERLFGAPPEPERGPGRPEIGRKIEVRIPDDMIVAIDTEQRISGSPSRGATIRALLVRGLADAEQLAREQDLYGDDDEDDERNQAGD